MNNVEIKKLLSKYIDIKSAIGFSINEELRTATVLFTDENDMITRVNIKFEDATEVSDKNAVANRHVIQILQLFKSNPELSQREIAKRIGITQGQVCTILSKYYIN